MLLEVSSERSCSEAWRVAGREDEVGRQLRELQLHLFVLESSLEVVQLNVNDHGEVAGRQRAEDDDVVVEYDGIRVLIDPVSAQYITGSEIDYKDGLMGAGFTVDNPNAVSSCGCGHSFRTAEDSGGEARSCGCGH